MIQPRAYDELGAMAVFKGLDPHDLLEAQITRGRAVSHLALFSDWHAMQAHAVLSLVVFTDPPSGAKPFGVLMLGNTGQAGVAQAAFLARDHRRFRRELVQAARAIRMDMPVFCRERGIHRIEARAWAGHPRAPRFLQAIGFQAEAVMPGFGASGAETFIQFAWGPAQTNQEESSNVFDEIEPDPAPHPDGGDG